eukprot:7229457-Pyramimonas_sp.AAC.1
MITGYQLPAEPPPPAAFQSAPRLADTLGGKKKRAYCTTYYDCIKLRSIRRIIRSVLYYVYWIILETFLSLPPPTAKPSLRRFATQLKSSMLSRDPRRSVSYTPRIPRRAGRFSLPSRDWSPLQ